MKTIKNVVALAVAVISFTALNVHAYFDPSVGRWASRDPIEENGGQNLYAYVNNNSINAFDPLGEKQFTIWAAAFIAPDEIVFPYVFVRPWPGFDPLAKWHGDNRGFGVIRGSSRAWNYVVIDTSSASPEKINLSGSGMSQVHYHAGIIPFTDYGLAPDPAKAEVSKPTPCMTVVNIDVSSDNPLTPKKFTPSIKYSYTLYFDEGKHQLTYLGSHTAYPWHELYVSGLGLLIEDSPPNPVPTPIDLKLWPPTVDAAKTVSY